MMSRASNTGVTTAIESTLGTLTSDHLLRFLSRQRWFGAKGEAPTGASVVDCVALGDALAIARVRVESPRANTLYQVPISALRALPSGTPATAVLAVVPDHDGDVHVFDALYDPGFRATLARGVVNGLSAGSPLLRWIVERASDGTRLSEPPVTHLIGVEQSNTSIIVDDVAIIKLFRRLVPGVHPDVEVARFLTTQAGFDHTPAFLGELRFEDEHSATTAGMTQRFVPGATDLWAYALERARPYFTAPEGRDAPNDFVTDAKRLGQTTREMHEALARRTDDPAFAPEQVDHDDVDRWAHRTQQSIREAIALLERQIEASAVPREREGEARALAGRREHYVGWVNEIADALGDDLGARIRIHGDYHLGQVLRAPDGNLVIIDFEGEPTKPLDERREKTSPARDVAGMLRSFAYVAATLVMEEGRRMKPHVRELRSARWERDVRNAFLDAYLAPADADSPSVLPSDSDDTRRLVELFETEKAFYELSYELNNRPTWSWIPMRGISKLFVRPPLSS
jgi:maltose alpha-D-glucosyltransferase/alpha-amylase